MFQLDRYDANYGMGIIVLSKSRVLMHLKRDVSRVQ
jgi:hypothetical protein